ncbi:MAG: histidinol-phosphatase, partial [Armatimonadota bacterium]
WALVASCSFDYLIGSVHFMVDDARATPWPIDLTRAAFEDGLRASFGGDIRGLVGAYYKRVRALVAWGRTPIVGHLDRIKKWNDHERYFREDEGWYRQTVHATLQACARAGAIVELNTVGWRNAVENCYPSPWILRQCLELGIPLIVTTDAHLPERVTDFDAAAETVLREIGCTELAVLDDEDGWRMERLSSSF